MKKIFNITFIYALVTGLLLFLSTHILKLEKTSIEGTCATLISLIIQSLIAIYAYTRYKKIDEASKGEYKILLITFIPISFLAIFSLFSKFEISFAFFAPIATAFLSGLNEELLFRGTIFPIFKKEKGLFKAIFLSAFIFALSHGLNILGGIELSKVLPQIYNTFLAGLFFACAYHYSKNIYLLILYHFLWNYVPLSGIFTLYPKMLIVQVGIMALEFIITIVLLIRFKKNPPIS